MRRIVLWLGSTATVVVLLFGYHTSTNTTTESSGSSVGTAPAPSATSSSSTRSSSGRSGSGSGGSDPGPSAKTKSPSTKRSPTVAKDYTGSVAQTRWGPVQVKITVSSGQVTDAAVVQSPSGNHKDLEINSHALPVLVRETIAAQSASIDMVSGATVTSTGYVKSLQGALDAAGL